MSYRITKIWARKKYLQTIKGAYLRRVSVDSFGTAIPTKLGCDVHVRVQTANRWHKTEITKKMKILIRHCSADLFMASSSWMYHFHPRISALHWSCGVAVLWRRCWNQVDPTWSSSDYESDSQACSAWSPLSGCSMSDEVWISNWSLRDIAWLDVWSAAQSHTEQEDGQSLETQLSTLVDASYTSVTWAVTDPPNSAE